MSWIKSACLFYCYKQFQRKQKIPLLEPLPDQDDDFFGDPDRIINIEGSTEIDLACLNREDVETILNLMPNKRYSELIRMHYLETRTHEETAEALGINMDNYYNVHKRAKSQYERVCRKEDYYG